MEMETANYGCYSPSIYSCSDSSISDGILENIQTLEEEIYLQELSEEIEHMKAEITMHRYKWDNMDQMLQDVYRGLILAQGAIDQYFRDIKSLKEDWLSFWGL